MALTAGTLWEIRSGGNDLNGAGFYDRDPGTSVDYSDQDAAQATFANLTTAGAGQTTLTDGNAGGLFTAAMAGNLIYIASGTNFTAGYYEIVTFTDTDNVVLDRTPTPAGAGATGAGKVGGGRQTITDTFLEGVSAGDTVYLENGTYALGAGITIAKDGTAAAPIILEGYNSSRGDNPTGDNRPLIDAGVNGFLFSNASYWYHRNLRLETDHLNGYRLGTYNIIRNCKITQEGNGGSDTCIYSAIGCIIFDCELLNSYNSGGYGWGIYAFGQGTRVIGCYIHDVAKGVAGTLTHCHFLFNIIAECTEGIDLQGVQNCTVMFNTFYGDGDTNGIVASNASANVIFGNTISGFTTGANWSTANKQRLVDYNNWYNNTADVSNFTKGGNATANDPQFTTPGSNFSLQAASALIDAATIIRLGVG